MALNFPSNPTLNQVYTGPLGQKWKWNGEAWVSFNEIVSVPTASYLNGFELDLDVPPADGDLLIYNTDISAWENSKTLTGSYGLTGSLAQGFNDIQILGDYSHAEGRGTKTGFLNAYSASIVNGIVTMSAAYGNVVGFFDINDYLYVNDPISNINSTHIVSQSYYDSINGRTILELYDIFANTTPAYIINVSGDVEEWGAGDQTIPSLYSHTEGIFTVSIGEGSHAEGQSTIAIGEASHAEGTGTRAVGQASHAEGILTKAIGSVSHAEGVNTQAIGEWSHAEGQGTRAIGGYSHAEGDSTQALFGGSHAEGLSTTASAAYSHAEGQETVTFGEYSHAEGAQTIALGPNSHAEGTGTQAVGLSSHAEGYYTQAIGDYSHAEGAATVTSASYQHAQGIANISSSVTGAFIVGNGTVDNGGNVLTRSNLIHAGGNVVEITGSLNVSGSITGSLQGTSSWANNAQTSSFVTASNVYGPYGSNSIISASYALTAETASYTLVFSTLYVTSSSYSETASYAFLAETASYVLNANTNQTASYAENLKVSGSITVTGSITISGSIATSVLITGSSYTATTLDSLIELTGNNTTASLYSVSGNRGRQLYIKNGGTGTILVQPSGSNTIDGRTNRRIGALESLLLQSDGSSDWLLLNNSQYSIQFAHEWTVGAAPSDTTTYYFGNFMAQGPSTTSTETRRVTAMVSGWATYVSLMVSVAGTLATSEDSTLVLANVTRGTTTTITTTLEHNTAAQLDTYTLATPLQIVKGDSLEMRWTTPNWGTNPSAVRHVAQVLVQ
jgi:hypothetical protein